MKPCALLLFLSLILVVSCSKDNNQTVSVPENEPLTGALYFPPLNTDEWETVSITDLGWNTEAEQPLLDFLTEKNTKAFLLLKNGRIAIEAYMNGASRNDANPWYSVGKTLTAFTMGLAGQEGFLDLDDPSSEHLGVGWSGLPIDEESKITVKHHISMTTGLDYQVSNQNCTLPECLTGLNEPGSFWYYHNAPYTLSQGIIAGALNSEFEAFFDSKLRNVIGMNGSWIKLGYAKVYYSTARGMARFGLLNLNDGNWDTTEVLTDKAFFEDMTNTSQAHNEAYGYLWWLNGKSSFRSPGSELQFPGKLIPNAPDDLIAGLGKDDQKLHIVPSSNLVVVRMGDSAGESLLGPSGFDNELWEKINALINN